MNRVSIIGVCSVLAFGLSACGAASAPTDALETNETSDSVQLDLAPALTAPEVVASGLDSPRGIAVDAHGTIYVAEAGVGGPGPCLTGPDGGNGCYGESGAITRIRNGTSERIIANLPSLANADGTSAIGVHDVVVRGNELFALTGLGLDPAVRGPGGTLGGITPKLGFLLRIQRGRGGEFSALPVADISAYETAHNPYPGHLESNPYGLLSDGGRWVVADAAGNDILSVSPSGTVSLLATLPGFTVDAPPPFPPGPLPVEPVPTSVVKGPDGAYYVGELTGVPFPPGGSSIYRIARGGVPEVYATGFTNVIDLAFDCRGDLLVLEISSAGLLSGNPAGELIRVKRDGSRETIAPGALIAPTSVAVGRRGEVFVSNCGVCGPGQGSLLRVE